MIKLPLSFICFLSFTLSAQNFGASTVSQYTNEALDIEIDGAGNIYTTGYLTGETAFNSNAVVPTAQGNGDVYIAKYGPQGNLIWQKTFGGIFSDRAYDLAIGPDQCAVITGQFFGTVTFGNYTVQSVANTKDIFLLKLDPTGSVLWARSEGGNMAENAYGVAVDNQNNVILTGQFQGNATIGNNNFTSAIDPVTNLYTFDFFISKYSGNGSPTWSMNGIAKYEDRGLAVSTDSQNNIFFTGQFSDTLQFAGNTYNNNGYNIGFVSKLSPTGQLQFFHLMRAGNVLPYDIEINAVNEAIIAGDFGGNMNYIDNAGPHAISNPFSKKLFAIKINNNGGYVWNYTLGSDNEISARSLCVDQQKDIYITGFFKCALSQIHDTATALFNSIGFKDPYLLKLNDNGLYQSIRHFGGKLNDEGHGVAVHQTDEPIVCGTFTSDLNFPHDGDQIPSNGLAPLHRLRESNFIETPHQYFVGDSSANSFFMKGINGGIVDYNYFIPLTNDTLEGFIFSPLMDTVHLCAPDNIYYQPNTYAHFGPSYNYIWQDGSSINPYFVNSTGVLDVIVKRNDNCATERDSIHVVMEPIPNLPELNDNVVLNTSLSAPYNVLYQFCFPDTLGIYFTNPDPNATTVITTEPNGNQVVGLGTNLHAQQGNYVVSVQNTYCTNVGYFHIEYDYVEPYDTIDLGIEIVGIPMQQDTITICFQQRLKLHGVDYLTNPMGQYVNFLQPTPETEYYINGGLVGGDTAEYHYFSPTQTGWYLIDLDLTLGYNNLCGIDTTIYHAQDSFYIIVNPLPTANYSLFGDNLLCENGSVFVVTTQTYPNFTWSGPGNFNIQPLGDSIEVTSPGNYFYGGTLVDSITGCAKAFIQSFTVQLKQPPLISSNPSNLICPYDSVLLQVPAIYTDYNWIGPNGNQLSLTDSCFGFDQGFYYVHVIDSSGCSLTSLPFELMEYATPSLSISPDPYLCENETVTLTVNHTGDCLISWSPVNSLQDEIVVSQAGTYTVSISQCGITVIDSVVIQDMSFQSLLTVSDTVLCFGESAIIIGSPNNATYQWSTGQTTGASYIVTNEGDYFATVTNSFGCIAYSDTVSISEVLGSEPPSITSVSICPGSPVTFSDTSSFQLDWFNTADTSVIITSNTINLPAVYEDTSWLVAYQVNGCPPAYGTVNVQLVDSIFTIDILGDSSFCINESGTFTLSSPNTLGNWQIGNMTFNNQNSISVPWNNLTNNANLSVSVANACFSLTVTDTLIFLSQEAVDIAIDSLFLCAYDESNLNLTINFDSITWVGNFGTIVTDEITINASTGTGYVYASAIGANGCPTLSDSTFLEVSDFSFTINTDLGTLCIGDSGFISVNTSPTDSLLWMTPFGTLDTTNFSIHFVDSTEGWYTFSAWDTHGCAYQDSLLISYNNLPVFDLFSDSVLCINDIFTLYFPSDTNSYSWSTLGGSTNIPILGNQELVLTATSPAGCSFSDTLFVLTVDCNNEIPNVITPNSDGNNDLFYIDDALAFPNNRLTIANRWGNIVAHYEGYANSFYGGELSEGTYFYTFYPDPEKDPNYLRRGFLQIIRD